MAVEQHHPWGLITTRTCQVEEEEEEEKGSCPPPPHSALGWCPLLPPPSAPCLRVLVRMAWGGASDRGGRETMGWMWQRRVQWRPLLGPQGNNNKEEEEEEGARMAQEEGV